MIHCRLLEEADRARIVELGQMHVEEITPWLGFDAGRVNGLVDRALRGNPTFFVAEDDGEVIGYLAAELAAYPASVGTYAQQTLFYVEPRKRGSRAATKLFAGFVRWAEHKRAREVFAGIGMGQRSAVAIRWARRFGFEAAGQHVLRRRLGGS